jgi:isocitrate dehydrogenase (NAD+)
MAGKNIANPTAVLRSALLMLHHIGESEAADRVRNALERVYKTRDKLTRDVGGKNGTSEFADAVIEEMENSSTANVSDESTRVG